MINSREEANKYYQLVNELVDNYLDKWKIKPSNLKKYLKPGGEKFNKFLERNKLINIKGIDKVLRDVIEDRHHMEIDGVITFESFNLLESNEFKIQSLSNCLYKGIDKADNKMEKVLADYFDSSLGQIDILDAGKHIFKVNNWESHDINVVIYSEDDIDIIIHNMIEYLYSEFKSKKIEITSSISIDIDDLIDESKFVSKMWIKFTDEFIIKTITDCLDGYEYKGESNKYNIWIKK